MSYVEIVSDIYNDINRHGYICFQDIYNILRANEDELLQLMYLNSNFTIAQWEAI